MGDAVNRLLGDEMLNSEAAPPPPTMLVVEDEEFLRELITEFFSGQGFQVLAAADADEAMRFLQAPDRDIAILLSDVRMPGSMDGIQLADWVHGHAPDLPVLLASGYHGRDDYDGRYEILPKPYALTEMLARVQRCLAQATGSPPTGAARESA
jgi:DNA-binding NtrC family response regulator